MDFLTAFIPAVGWGVMPILAYMTKASPREQLTGTVIGAVLFALCLYIIQPASLAPIPFGISFISGIFWAAGQLLQFRSFQKVSASIAIPVICGLQLIGTTLFAALILGEWITGYQYGMGVGSLLCILAGVLFTSYQGKSAGLSKPLPLRIIMMLVCSGLALSSYVVINQYFNILELFIILPQSLGMLCSAIVINLKGKHRLRFSPVLRNLSTGLVWSIANLALFISNSLIGMAASFPISQASIAIACVGSILIFKEKKSSQEWIAILVGITVLMIGVGMISLLKP
ncbi:GRP family sugar transporter [Paenibacillus polymyxa]|uniref:GRP family sugar transporter n=1 Tax=Paenibacillus polymyxa TaxID=1406 RepID=UPI0025B63338|nr:GRP family sugar transporter [Paenibacillus polymyxa]MDN4079415.1 GRP family sugar transporter [Paenibacillus polymyxa]MDN4104837.1 GRP family sugar transporter [Paenibacillus polymyxa]MDN4115126.1 GRP family sugar transporter [Paenibacillus polymyxa]